MLVRKKNNEEEINKFIKNYNLKTDNNNIIYDNFLFNNKEVCLENLK